MAVEFRPYVPEQARISLKEQPFQRVSGLVVASDGVNRHNVLDVVNSPFYGGWKLLLKDKILNPDILLTDQVPLVEPAIKAMFDAESVRDFVVVGNEDQCEYLEEIASKNSNGKPYKVLPNRGRIGEAVEVGVDSIALPGYFFAIMPDLPYANGEAVDFAVADVLKKENIGADVYLPVVSAVFFRNNANGWTSTFSRIQNNGKQSGYKGLNFVIANSENVNPQAINKYYEIRMVHSLKGILNAARHFPALVPEVALRYLSSRLSMSTLEEMGSELYRGELKVVEVSDPLYISFMKDIDTLKDYAAYKQDVSNRRLKA